jgi:hypothetical protein
MWHCAGIVFLKPGIQVIGDAGVEMFPSETLEDVDIFHDLSAFAEISTRQHLPAFGQLYLYFKLNGLAFLFHLKSAYASATAWQTSPSFEQLLHISTELACRAVAF